MITFWHSTSKPWYQQVSYRGRICGAGTTRTSTTGNEANSQIVLMQELALISFLTQPPQPMLAYQIVE